MTRVLIVEDEESYAEPMAFLLEREGFSTAVAADGSQALAEFDHGGADIVLLDLMLPGISGTDVCRELRRRGAVPVIMVTARDSEVDKVVGLEIGADDYITKPYSARELIARIRAVLRRGQEGHGQEGRGPEGGGQEARGQESRGPGSASAGGGGADGDGAAEHGGQARQAALEAQQAALEAGPVRMDVDRHVVTVSGIEVMLPLKEFDLLEYLLRNLGKVLTRAQLIDRVWGSDYVGDTKTLDVHIKRLRSKIEHDPAVPQYLLTVRGLGYKLEA